MKGDRLILRNVLVDNRLADVAIGGEAIQSISAPAQEGRTCVELPSGRRICYDQHLAVFPGLHNMHSHAPMTLLRGLGDDQPLDRWLHDYIWPAEQRLTDEDVQRGTLQACHEMLSSGTTFFNDMYFQLPAMARAVEASGIAARLGLNVFGDATELDDPATLDLLSHPTDRVSYSIAPHSVYTVSQQGLLRAARACERLGLPMHIHMSETQQEVDTCVAQHGCRPWQWLDQLGILDRMGNQIIAAHCLHLSDDEIELIGRHGITCVHCPNSNLKLGSGYRFPMLELIEAGARVALGTDGAASSNSLDMVEAMKVATLLQKGWRGDPTAVPARQALDIATLGHQVAAGQPADLMLTTARTLSDLVYASHGGQVEMTLVHGDIAYQKTH